MLLEHLNRRRCEREAAALLRRRRVVESPCAPVQQIADASGAAQHMLGFCSNDYLGLATHPVLQDALVDGARRWGTGSGASHLVSGHTREHQALEAALAAFLSPWVPGAAALSFCSGYMANLALLTTLGDGDAEIFADKLNHASLIDGGLLAQARMQRYPHGQLDRLETLLDRSRAAVKLIVTDAVFSMDGDVAPLPDVLALAERYDAWVVVDDAHGFGVLGAALPGQGGQGVLAHFGLSSERFIYMGTLGKAAGVSGAFVAAHPAVIDALIQGARSYIYTTAMPAALACALRSSLALIAGEEGDIRRRHLSTLIRDLRQRLEALITGHPELNWRLADSATAIQPLIVGSNAAALSLSAGLEARGLWVPAIRPPTVPANAARLRITLSAAHCVADLDRLCEALEALAREGVSA